MRGKQQHVNIIHHFAPLCSVFIRWHLIKYCLYCVTFNLTYSRTCETVAPLFFSDVQVRQVSYFGWTIKLIRKNNTCNQCYLKHHNIYGARFRSTDNVIYYRIYHSSRSETANNVISMRVQRSHINQAIIHIDYILATLLSSSSD